MKKIIRVLLLAAACVFFESCGVSRDGRSFQNDRVKTVSDVMNEIMNEKSRAKESTSDGSRSGAESVALSENVETVDVDLTKMSSTMVYSEVFNMMTEPESYIGKKIRMKGSFS